jgi:SAM-dependent methyltransferase
MSVSLLWHREGIMSAFSLTPMDISNIDRNRRLGDVLFNLEYHTTKPLQLCDTLETALSSFYPTPRQMAISLRRIGEAGVLGQVTRLFLLGETLSVAEASAALAPVGLEEWQQSGLLHLEGDRVSAPFQLAGVQNLLILSNRTGSNVDAHHVMGYSGSTATLSSLTLRSRFSRILDLGTGGGALALLASRHGNHVVGCDRNPRAINFAKFNAQLNHIDHFEALEGDWFSPVVGQQFDLVFSNPPFVISPEASYLFRDGGLQGDDLAQKLLREAPSYLSDGGWFQMMFEWIEPKGEDWRSRLAGWIHHAGCDAFLCKLGAVDPAKHAETWASFVPGETPEALAQRMNQWTAHYRSMNIENIGWGVITLRRRSGGPPNWLRCEMLSDKVEQIGSGFQNAFALQDFLSSVPSDQALLESRFVLSDDLVWRQELAPSDEGWQITLSRVRLQHGMRNEGDVNEHVLGILDRCRGEKPLGQVLSELAQSVGAEVDLRGALGAVKMLIAQGFLLPVR